MRLALDLDGTVLIESASFALERPGLAGRLTAVEPLRLGARELCRRARDRGVELWVYTSSMRSEVAIRWLFAAHGVWLDGVINEQRHREAERRAGARWPAKYPLAFGIDLLVDDSLSVERAGREHGFRVLRLRPDDEGWVARVLGALGALQREFFVLGCRHGYALFLRSRHDHGGGVWL